MDLTAYSDDSYEPHNDFVIGGYVAPASEWLKLEQPWRRALAEFNLGEYKACDCEQGRREFKGRRDRREIQHRFISLIRSVDAAGFATRIDLRAYDEMLYNRVKVALPKTKHRFFEPFPKVLEMQLQFILNFAIEAYPDVEQINFVIDEQTEFAGRAVHLFRLNQANRDLAHRERLGSLEFGVSADLVGLQAADLLAYEVHRQHRRGPISANDIRWQSAQLSERGKVRIAYLDKEAVRAWADLYRDPSK